MREHPPPIVVREESAYERWQFRSATVAVAVAAGLAILWCALARGAKGLLEVLVVLALAQVLGKWIIFGGAFDRAAYGPWTVALMIFVAEMVYAVALAAGLMRLERARFIGPWIHRARDRAERAFSDYPGLRRMAFWGVALWVFLPLPASGAVTGSFAARLVGLSRMGSISAVLLGSAANSAIFAALAQLLGERGEALLRNPLAMVASAIALLLFLWIGWRHVHRALKQH